MPDPISTISGGLSIAGSIVQFLDFIKNIAGSDVISGYFKFDGTKVEGSDKIVIELHPVEECKEVFWLSVRSFEDYAFVRIPINESCVHELIGTEGGEKLPNPRYWRWVAKPRPNVIVGGNYTPPNVKMDFIVIGYRPKAIIKHFST